MKPEDNLAALKANSYPGRGLCVGMDETGRRVFQVYWIMGRSANSRNRIFVSENGTLRTAPADPAKVQDPSRIIYNAMRELTGVFIATNGDQTDTIYDNMKAGGSFADALQARTYEPDAPSFTARISSVCDLRPGGLVAQVSILKKSPFADAAERHLFQYEALPKGAGYTVTTYAGDGNPLPRFEGEPYLLPIRGSARAAAEILWGALDAANRVALAVKTIDLSSAASEIEIINAYKPV